MKIESVKLQNGGYVINDNLFVPAAEGNRDYRAVQKWIADGGNVEPEFSEEKILQNKVAKKKAERDAKLRETDIYLVADFPISSEKLEQMKSYREYLRHIPRG